MKTYKEETERNVRNLEAQEMKPDGKQIIKTCFFCYLQHKEKHIREN